MDSNIKSELCWLSHVQKSGSRVKVSCFTTDFTLSNRHIACLKCFEFPIQPKARKNNKSAFDYSFVHARDKRQIRLRRQEEGKKKWREFTLLPGWSRTEPHNCWGCSRSLRWSGSAPATSPPLCTHQRVTQLERHTSSSTNYTQSFLTSRAGVHQVCWAINK